jgi:2Fe-2S ferredoxin
VYLDDSCGGRFPEASNEERELLEFTDGVQRNSRLACQLILTDDCDPVRVTVAGTTD